MVPDALVEPCGRNDDLSFALRLADVVDAVTLPRFRAVDLEIDRKPDRTPVTDADLAAEDMLRATIERERPDDDVLGEERGGSISTGGRSWILDPIDGTKNFSRGLPVWATLIGLAVAGRPVSGVVSAPALGRRWWASAGQGAWTADFGGSLRRLRVSGVRDLGDAYVSTTDYRDFASWRDGRRWDALARSCWETRAFGDFWQHCMVAEGVIDVAVEAVVKPWDVAALFPIVTEAGGQISDLSGADTIESGTVLATNGALHDAALVLLREGAASA